MKPKYGLVTYATYTNILIKVSDPESSNAALVTEKLNKISYEGQSQGSGRRGWWEVHSLWGQRGQRFRGAVRDRLGTGRTTV